MPIFLAVAIVAVVGFVLRCLLSKNSIMGLFVIVLFVAVAYVIGNNIFGF